MDAYMHKIMVSLEKIEIIRSQGFMPSEARLNFLKKTIILETKTAILGPQFCRILVLGPLDPPLNQTVCNSTPRVKWYVPMGFALKQKSSPLRNKLLLK